MAFLETHVFSQALEVAVTVNVLLPEPSQGIGLEGANAQEPPRVMYLLHGYSDDQSIWMRRTSVERYCAKYNLAVIMPAVNHSYYANELQGERYWDYVSQELPQMMHSMFRLSQAPGTELVAGLSMGVTVFVGNAAGARARSSASTCSGGMRQSPSPLRQ